MKKIIAPIRLQEQSLNVANLHEALQALDFPVSADEKARQIAGTNTIEIVRRLQRQFNVQFDDRVVVDSPTADLINRILDERGLLDEDRPIQFKVSGKVFNQFGQPINEKTVMAFDVDLRGAAIYNTVDNLQKLQESNGFELLGRTVTNDAGQYEILFTAETFQRAEKGLADVIAYLIEGEMIVGRSILATKKDYINGKELVNFHIFGNGAIRSVKSEYARLMEELRPLLQQSNLGLSQLDEATDQVRFLATETEQAEDKITLLVKAAKMNDNADGALSHELLYGVGRQDILLSWFALASVTDERILTAVNRSIQSNITGIFDDAAVRQFVTQLRAFANNRFLDEHEDENGNNLATVLNLAIPDRALQNSFVQAYQNFSGSPEKFWNEFLPQQPGFAQNSEGIRALQFTNQLILLTGNHLPLIEELQVGRGIKTTKQLLELPGTEWKNIITAVGLPPEISGDNQLDQYVEHVQGLLHAAHPTEKISMMIRSDELKYDDQAVKAGMGAFFESAVDFDFSNSRVEDFDAVIRSVSNGKAETIKKELKTIQRIYQVSSSPTVMKKLLDKGISSSFQISTIPQQSFMEMYGGELGAENAASVYLRASYNTAQSHHVAMKLYELTNGFDLGSTTTAPLNEAVVEVIKKHIPNYEELFGRADICECQDCTSVYSASAYLVDIMQFLAKSTKNAVNKTPLDQLLLRRPDLAYTLLTCENTNTIIPYIDLVNEVLEFYTVNDKLDGNAAHDTGDSTAQELRANPQYTMIEAYKKLKDAVYPFSLPYHQPLDNIRKYLEHLRTSRYYVMKTFRNDALPENDRAIFSESLNLSQEEYEILTGRNFLDTDTSKNLWEYYGFANDNELKGEIFQVPSMLKQTGILYTDLVELVKTKFINPNQFTLDYLEKLFGSSGIAANEIYTKLSQIESGVLDPATDIELMAVLDANEITAPEFSAWVNNNFVKFQETITLYEPESQCDLEHTTLRSLKSIYENLPTPGIADDTLSRLHRFIRLWRKTGWSIHDVDNNISALGETDITVELITKLSIVKSIESTLKPDLRQLVCCWGNIETYDKKSLYVKLFLNKAVQKIDEVFKADKFGNYLSNPAILIKDHTPAILAAFRLNAESFAAIVEDSQLDLNTAALTLENLSIIYRYVFLSKALKSTVADLCLLKNLFGKDPFSKWDSVQNRFINIDPQATAEFIDLNQKIKTSGFKLQQLKYILQGTTSPDANIALPDDKIRQTIKTIHESLQKVEQDHPESDLENITDELMRAKLQILFTPAVAIEFLAMVDGKTVYTSFTDKNLPIVIPAALTGKVSYVKASGRLQYTGIISDGDKSTLENLAGATAAFKKSVQDIYDQPERFLKDNFSGIFGIAIGDATKKLLDHPTQIIVLTPAEKWKLFYKSYLPFLKKQLKQNIVVQYMASMVGLDEVTMQTLLNSQVEDIVNTLTETGLSARYFKDATFTLLGVQRVDPVIDFKWKTGSPDATIPVDNFSARWEGWICPGQSAEYSFIAEVQEADEAVKVWIDDQLAIEKPAGDPMLSWEAVNSLAAGKMYKLRLDYSENIIDAGIRLLWQTANQPKEVVPAEICYPDVSVQKFTAIAGKIHRAAIFINGFKMSALEVEHFKKFPANFSNIDFTAIQKEHWSRINDYVQLRDQLPRTSSTLIEVFDVANKTNPVATINALIAKTIQATGWNSAYLDYLVNTHFNFLPGDFKNEIILARLNKAMSLARKTEADVALLAQWSRIETDFGKLNEIAQDIKNTVKAKYEETDWLEVSKQLSDKIREDQKQALISYLLQKKELRDWGVEDADGLYEYFLIDVQMQPIMDTSRIKQAISSVQQFISRCLLNLESERNNANQEIGVSPGAIDTNRWEWMKNYRVWEANRKVFLYPENWLEPDWRDDKSSFFKELESDLLQNDITTESVEKAFRNYLFKLNEVANMQVCGMYQDEATNTLHVFSRTHTEPYRYYYRNRDQYNHWSSWEKVSVDIKPVKYNREGKDYSGVHLVPVVWKKRLLLFWTEFMEKTEPSSGSGNTAQAEANTTQLYKLDPAKHWHVNLAWSEYKDGKWSPKELSKEVLTPGVTIKVKDLTEFLIFQKAEFTELAKEYRFNALVDSANKLNIKMRLNNEDDHGNFKLPDIQSKITTWYAGGSFGKSMPKVSSGSASSGKTLVGKASIGVVGDALLGAAISAFENPSRYKNNFMAFELEDELKLRGNTYFKKNQLHNILYSHHIKSSTFEGTLNYPFFYFDEERSYFISPEDITYWVVAIKQPEKQPYYPFEKIKDKYYVEKLPIPKVGPDDFKAINENMVIDADPGVNGNMMRTSASSLVAGNLHGNALPAAGSFELTGAKVKSKTSNMKSSITLQSAFGGASQFTDKIAQKIGKLVHDTGLRVRPFFHPYSSDYITVLNEDGVGALQAADTQLKDDKGTNFKTWYSPNLANGLVISPLPAINVDFDEFGAYSSYNWELFFHAPLFIATRLSKNGKYSEAMKWFHYIFDPTTSELPDAANPNARYWQVLPFKTEPKFNLENYLKNLSTNENPVEKLKLINLINEWKDDPFKPHLIARSRPIAYMKNVVIKYVENLIAWGDSLFMTDTMENINEATQLYVMAGHVLGPRPQFVPKRGTIQPETYHSLQPKLDEFSNALVEMENIFPFSSEISGGGSPVNSSLLGIGKALYFSIPYNDKILTYWDTVADRLFKIRHSMNIDGVERKLALFEPPIDPALLVQAAAKGLSLGSVLADLNSPAPFYRFNYLLQKAREFCNEVKSLGVALLSSLEKRDTEELARKRATHETGILNLMRAHKQKQILEAKINKQGLEKTRVATEKRLQYYLDLLDKKDYAIPPPPSALPADSNEDTFVPDTIVTDISTDVDTELADIDERGLKILNKEKNELDKLDTAFDFQQVANATESAASLLNLIPNISFDGKFLGIGAGFSFGGSNLGSATSAAAKAFSFISNINSFHASESSKLATYIRREQDWASQANMAARELPQLDKQILAAEIRIQLAQKDLENHDQQIINALAIEDYLKTKFTGQELYQWMADQLFSVHKQAYQMAYDMARKAEKAYRFELGKTDTNFIQFGYWDSAYQGLTSGEKLDLALRQMEKKFLEDNKREFELTKHVSLSLLNPYALLQLKQTGSCEISIPEELFDLDYPGHYFRRIKSVGLSIPAITGPYTTVNCTLRLLKNSIRINTSNGDAGYAHNNDDGLPVDDERFVENNIPFKSIATSTGQNDNGVFELNFRDDRYLPFEGAGVISNWKLECNGKYVVDGNLVDLSQFDYNSISDVILHIHYTSREDAGKFRQDAVKNLEDYMIKAIDNAPEPFVRLFSFKQDFPDAFHLLMNPPGNQQTTEITISKHHFNRLFANKSLNVAQTVILLAPKEGKSITNPTSLTVDNTASGAWVNIFNSEVKKATIPLGEFDPIKKLVISATGIQPGDKGLKSEEIDDVLLLLFYRTSV